MERLLTLLPPAPSLQGLMQPLACSLHLSLAAHARLLIAGPATNFGEEARLLALLPKALKGLFEGLTFSDANTRHSVFTPSDKKIE
jgi:hypothetical protein